MSESPAQILAKLPANEYESFLAGLTQEQRANLKYHWPFWARPEQLTPDGDWNVWLALAGRGFGKTRMGSEWIREMAEKNPGCRIALVAETAADARDVMVLGDSGLIACDPNLTADSWSPTNRRITWPNGSRAWCYNATEPDQLRGPQHHFAWVDELAKFRYMRETWDQLQFGLRLGEHPRALVTTTPRPEPLIRELLLDEATHVTRGRTADNHSNLAAPFLRAIQSKYSGTRLGRQELEGELLEDIPGALWTRESIDSGRRPEHPDLQRIVVAIDPAVTSGESSDETGIIAVGLWKDPDDGAQHAYVLADRSVKGTPDVWAKAAVNLYHELDADRIVAEVNNGGDMIEGVIRAVDRNIPYSAVRASRGKRVRAEPVAALYEQGRVHHVGRLDVLEDQMCLFSGETGRSSGDSPDRVDALVWGVTFLFEKLTARRRSASTESVVNYNDPHNLGHGSATWMA